MNADEQNIREVFLSGGDLQYVLPYFQRDYAWNKSNWKTLLDDIMELQTDGDHTKHFMGALVVKNEGLLKGALPGFTLVDGQQRLTTLSIIIRVLAESMDDHNYLYKSMIKLLVNPDAPGDFRFKIVPTEKHGDREAYFSIMLGKPLDRSESRILDAYRYFREEIPKRLKKEQVDAETMCRRLLEDFQFVYIALDKSEKPYKIFESLNAKGRPLTEPDKVRNYIAMRLPSKYQKEVFDQYWVKIEELLDERRTTGRFGELTAFLRHYIAHHTGALPRKDLVYARFRDRMETHFGGEHQFVSEIRQLHLSAIHYEKLLRPHSEDNLELREALHRLNRFEMSSSYPLWLYLYEQVRVGRVPKHEFVASVKVFENYLARRFLAGEPTNFNKMFPALVKELRNREDVVAPEYVRDSLLQKSYPSDNRLFEALRSARNFDNRSHKRLVVIFEALERHLWRGSDGYAVLDDRATIEHIMPQTLSNWWRSHLGNRGTDAHADNVNAIGNLTLVTQKWNSELSNGSFLDKKQKLQGHVLHLNGQYFGEDIALWDAEAIQTRSAHLAELILEVWPALGDTSKLDEVTGRKPSFLTVRGKKHELRSWKELRIKAAELGTVMISSDYFGEFASSHNAFSLQPGNPKFWTALPNEWWVYHHTNKHDAVKFVGEVFSAAGLSLTDWELETK